MATTKVQSSKNRQKLEDYRAYQEEMLQISREYRQARLAVWADETRSLHDTWNSFTQEWGSSLEQAASRGGSAFEEMAARGESAANLLGQSWQQNLTDISGAVETWGANFLETLAEVAAAWVGTGGSGGSSQGGWGSLLGGVLDFGGWFHQGGIVEAHQGMVIAPGTLMEDEQLILAQAGEGILPRESMARLGEKNFESLRTGRFDLNPGSTAPRFDVTIQVQTLDTTGVAALNWDRLVQRHLLPALRQEADRRW
jgi:hypothetical protein